MIWISIPIIFVVLVFRVLSQLAKHEYNIDRMFIEVDRLLENVDQMYNEANQIIDQMKDGMENDRS